MDVKQANFSMKKCVICKSQIIGFGHNPYPIFNKGRCCEYCNSDYVFSIRMLEKINPSLAESVLKQFHLGRKINSIGI
jgi:hypothetical protein